MQEIYCKHFKHIRTRDGVKIETISRHCHLSPAYLSQWENGKRQLEESQITSLYQQFNLDFQILKASYKKNLPILEEAYRAILFFKDANFFLEQLRSETCNLENSIEYPYYLVLCFLASSKTLESKKYIQIINNYSDLLSELNQDIFLLSQGVYWYCHNDQKQALYLLNQINKTAETSQVYALAQLYLSRIYRLHLQFSQAIGCNNQAEELFREAMNIPRFIECVNQRGLIYMYNGCFQDAIHTFKDALRHADFLQVALVGQNIYDNLAFSHLFLKQYDQVIDLSQRYQLIVPNQANACYFYLGWAAYHLGQEDQCRDLLKQAQAHPPHALMTIQLCALLQSIVDHDDTLQEARLLQCIKAATSNSTSIILIFVYQLAVEFYRNHSRYKRALYYSDQITQLFFGPNR